FTPRSHRPACRSPARSTRGIMTRLRWYHLGASFLMLLFAVMACSALLDHDTVQCNTDQDCDKFSGHPYCQNHLCVASNLGPDGCYFGTPSSPDQFANQCSTAQCEQFDNCERLQLCGSGAMAPNAIDPPMIDAGAGSTVDAPPPAPTPCVDPASR